VWELCYYLPVTSVVASWILIRLKKQLAVVALLVVFASTFAILGPRFWTDGHHGWILRYSLGDLSLSDFVRFWFSVLAPLAAIALFYFTAPRKKPNQPIERTRGTGP